MGTKIFIAAVAFFSLTAFTINVPEAVTKALEKKFPGASSLKWEKENTNEYEAGFSWGGAKYSANFSASGVWLETEKTISLTELPAKVRNAFDEKHKTADVKEVSYIETASGKHKYEIEYVEGAKTVEILFDTEGNEIK